MKRQQGMALITVLLIIALMTTLAVLSQRHWTQALQRATSQHFLQQTRWTLKGAETWLRQQPAAVIDNRTQQLQLDDSLVHYRWRDRQHCFNLNALGQHARINDQGKLHRTSAQQLFARLLAQIGFAEDEIGSVLAQLQSQLNPGGQKQWPLLLDKSELRPLFTAARWTQLAPLICALPDNALRININALSMAEIALVQALFGEGFDPAQASQLLNQRPAAGWKTLDAFIAAAPGDVSDAVSLLQSISVLESEYWELTLWQISEAHFAMLRSQFFSRDNTFSLQHRQFGLSEAP